MVWHFTLGAVFFREKKHNPTAWFPVEFTSIYHRPTQSGWWFQRFAISQNRWDNHHG